ncbi:MAG: hypothetical protein IKS52_04650 [Clostridia bacterium]|nr:hypothetical protein [Clostridia bacterium]
MTTNMHGVKLITTDEMLAERRTLLLRIEAMPPYPGQDRMLNHIRGSIRVLEARLEAEMNEAAQEEEETAEPGARGAADAGDAEGAAGAAPEA